MLRLLQSTLVIIALTFGVMGGHSYAQQTGSQTFNLAFQAVENVWNKSRLVWDSNQKKLRIRDVEVVSFDDASLWELKFNRALPYGRKTVSFTVELGDAHKPLWGNSLFQPLINGEQAEPALTHQGQVSYTPIIASDGRYFVPVGVRHVQLNLKKSLRRLHSVSVLTAGAKAMDITLSNFKVTVWPEVDNRIFPQRPFMSTLPFNPNEKKILLLDLHDDADSLNRKEVVLSINGPEGPLYASTQLNPKYSIASASYVSTINLSGLSKPGNYVVTVPSFGGRTGSADIRFSIGSKKSRLSKYRDEAWGAFYWVTDGYAGPHKGAHLQDKNARVFDDKGATRDVSGGWFDAGDYGKYTVNGAYSVSLMLLTGLHAPTAVSHPIDPLAKGSKKQPDWLDVARVELNWLLKMQGTDGGVNHKATTRFFPNMEVAPKDDGKTKWVMPTTTTATADFAATMDLAALVYGGRSGEADRLRAETYRNAATKARAWLASHPKLKMIEFSYNGFDYGGPYHDDNDEDERFFAAATYAATSRDSSAIELALTLANERSRHLKKVGIETDWRTVDLLGFWSLKLIENELGVQGASLVNRVLEQAAYGWQKAKSRSPWRIANPDRAPLYWGSNGVLATAGWHWLLWSKVSGKQEYAKDALDQLNWFFGRNPLGKIFVTGSHPKAVKAPHFRPWSSGAIALPPGLLAGGSNSGDPSGDPIAERLKGRAPMRIYIDDVGSFATNEVAINWQSPWALYLSLATSYRENESN